MFTAVTCLSSYEFENPWPLLSCLQNTGLIADVAFSILMFSLFGPSSIRGINIGNVSRVCLLGAATIVLVVDLLALMTLYDKKVRRHVASELRKEYREYLDEFANYEGHVDELNLQGDTVNASLGKATDRIEKQQERVFSNIRKQLTELKNNKNESSRIHPKQKSEMGKRRQEEQV